MFVNLRDIKFVTNGCGVSVIRMIVVDAPPLEGTHYITWPVHPNKR